MTGWSRHLLWLCMCLLVLLGVCFAFSEPVLIGPVGSGQPRDPNIIDGVRIFGPIAAPTGVWKRGLCFDLTDIRQPSRFSNKDVLGFNIRTYPTSRNALQIPLTSRVTPPMPRELTVAIPFGMLFAAIGAYPVFALAGFVRVRMFLYSMNAKRREIDACDGMDSNRHAASLRDSKCSYRFLRFFRRCIIVFVHALCFLILITVAFISTRPTNPVQPNSPDIEYSLETGNPGNWIGVSLRKPPLEFPSLVLRVYSISGSPGAWRWFYSLTPTEFFKSLQVDELRQYTDGTSDYHTRFTSKLPLIHVSILSLFILMAFAGWFWAGRRIRRTDRCLRCQYNLTGNQSGVCPECGLICSAGLLVATDD